MVFAGISYPVQIACFDVTGGSYNFTLAFDQNALLDQSNLESESVNVTFRLGVSDGKPAPPLSSVFSAIQVGGMGGMGGMGGRCKELRHRRLA